MATLSVLSYGSLPQGLTMKNSSGGTPTGGDTTPTSAVGGGGSKTISLGKTFSRITMQSVLSEHTGNALNISNNNNVNTIVRKIKDFGMFGTVNGTTGSSGLTRKRTLSETKVKLVQRDATTVATKKPKLAQEANNTPNAAPKTVKKPLDLENRLKLCANSGQVMKKTAGTPGRKGLPLPQAVARRNARERNRVKQVNNGFAALRERIPEEVAEAFETPGTGRSSAAKKLSKVETLRMAVEYIRSLERLLGFDFPAGSDRGLSLAAAHGSSSEDSFTLVKDEFEALSPTLDDNFDDSLSNYDMDEYLNASDSQYNPMPESNDLPQYQLDLLPNITTLNGLQYIRIPGTNTYQLLTPDIFIGNSNSPPNSSIDEEPFSNSALIDTNCPSPTTSSTSTAADLHSSPPSIMTSAAPTATATAPANALHPVNAMTRTTTTRVNVEAAASGECVNVAAGAALSRSPVPQSTSPTASSSLHHQQQQTPQQQQQHVPTVALSPAGNEVLLRTCAGERRFVVPTAPPHQQQQQILQPHAIKQECSDTTDFVPNTSSPTAQQTASPLFRAQDQTHYQQQQQQQQQQPLILGHATLSMSPPLERSGAMTLVVPTSTANTSLQSFYERQPESELEQSVAFYEGVVTFKKELSEVLLHTAAAAEAASVGALSDESMMEAIDWWEAHTPKSDGGAAML